MSKGNLVVMSDQMEKIRFSCQLIIELLKERHGNDLLLLDSNQQHFSELREEITYTSTKESFEEQLDNLYDDFQQRIEGQSFINLPKYCVLFNPALILKELDATHQKKLIELLLNSHSQEIYIIVVSDANTLTSSYTDVKKTVKSLPNILLQMKASDQSVFQTDIKSYGEQLLAKDEAYYVLEGIAGKIKLATI
jgi:hypothetical protein